MKTKIKSCIVKYALPDYDDCVVLPKRKGISRCILEFHFYGHLIRSQNEDAWLYDLEELPDWANGKDKNGNDLYIQTLRDIEWHLN